MSGDRLLSMDGAAKYLSLGFEEFQKTVMRTVPILLIKGKKSFDPADLDAWAASEAETRRLARGPRGPRVEALGLVYAVEAVGASRIKVGWTRGLMEVRFRALQAGAPFRLVVRSTMPGTLRDERAAHARLAEDRVEGTNEWFHLTERCEAAIKEIWPREGGQP